MSEVTTFVDEVLAGNALAQDVDDWVDAWHDADESSNIAELSLPDYLGFNQLEYATWVERPEFLRFIFAGRKTNTAPATAEFLGGELVAAAARADNDAEAASVVQWLKEKGRL